MINHPYTKTWMVANRGKINKVIISNYNEILFLEHNYIRKAFTSNTSGLANLQWDSAELTQIGVQTQMSFDDVFTLEEVE